MSDRTAVFLDRDGTLMEEVEYCRDPALVRLFPGIPDALSTLRAAGFLRILVTNQSGIGRGWISPAEYAAVHARFLELAGEGAIDAVYMCPDAPDAPSTRRKPAPGMLLEAAREWQLDLARCWMIGDKASDVECGRRAGCRSILVRTGYGTLQLAEGSDAVVPDFAAAVQHLTAAASHP